MNGISKLLSTDGFIQVNKTLIKQIGLHEAIIIGELCSEYNYWEEHNKLEDGKFYSTRENIENNTGLNDHYQRKAFAVLKDLGIIEITKKGLPAVNYYKINFDKLLTTLNSSSSRDEEQDIQEMNLNNNKQTKIEKQEKVVSKDTTTEFQFGSKQKQKKESLYTKCLNLIDSYDFSTWGNIRKLLIDYLNYRLSVKEKPLYSNMWKGMLSKLANLCDNDIDMYESVIMQSIERGYLSFYPVSNSSYSKDYDVTRGKAWEEHVSCRQATPEELVELERLDKEREAMGLRTRF